MRQLIEKEVFKNITEKFLNNVNTWYCEIPCFEKLASINDMKYEEKIIAVKLLEPEIKKAISLQNDKQLLRWLKDQHWQLFGYY